MGIPGDFQEVGHCGGQFTVNVRRGQDGHREVQLGVRHSRPTPASWVGVLVTPFGVPVRMAGFGGLNLGQDQAADTGYLTIFVASDSQGMFGRECRSCKNYWRVKEVTCFWPMTCPYCGIKTGAHAFFTRSQVAYLAACCALVAEAFDSDTDGESVIDMDQVADEVAKGGEKPKFFYAETSQQNKFSCDDCGSLNDILGVYGYCSNCGKYNALNELENTINGVRKKVQQNEPESCIKAVVSAFDTFARQLTKQLVSRIPMTPGRRNYWDGKLFHNLKSCAEGLRNHFDINLCDGLDSADIDFAVIMFHRRHLHEHNGGEVDQRYLDESGDTSVKLKQVIRESSESASRIANIIMKMGKNFDRDFHKIFPTEQKPSQTFKDQQKVR